MSKQKILSILTIVLILIFSAGSILNFTPEAKNYNVYSQALSEYNNNHFSQSYYLFGKVSKFSKLKQAALYRQALCANKLGDKKTELKKYKEIINRYSNSILAIRAKYLKAQLFYESKKYKKAEKEFKKILTDYPETDYAKASEYYLGSIEAEKYFNTKNKKRKLKHQNKAIQHFKTYLKIAPTGRFALSCVDKWVSLNKKLNNEDNLIIARIYENNQKYKLAKKYLDVTNLGVSWPYLVKNAYETKQFYVAKCITEEGLKGKGSEAILINENINEKTENQNIYDAIDIYLKISDSPKSALSYLLSISQKSKGYDYLLYKSCNNLPANNQAACLNTLYLKYPNGQFAAEALANIFYDKVKSEKYFVAKKLGKEHLAKFSHSNSAPKVMFWLAKVSERTKNYEEAGRYYRSLIQKHPDDYYAYRAFLNLNRFKHFNPINLRQKPIEFPYKNSNYGIISELLKVKDYGLISQLCQTDEFIQSWLAYLQGDFSTSARIARDKMEKLPQKPNSSDPKWRLVYPIHYYNDIERSASYYRNDPILILSIIREESYFNPNAQSQAGAMGLMQLMPSTAKEAALNSGTSLPSNKMLFDPTINIKLGNIYYSRLKNLMNNKDILAVLAYNGGLGSVSKWKEDLSYRDIDDFIEQIPYPETQNYLKKVYRSYWNYIRIYNGVK